MQNKNARKRVLFCVYAYFHIGLLGAGYNIFSNNPALGQSNEPIHPVPAKIELVSDITSPVFLKPPFGIAIVLLAAFLLIWYRLHRASQQTEKTRRLLKQRGKERTADRHESQKRFELAFESTNDGIWDWPDINKNEKYWSPQFKKLLGYEEDEIEAGFQEFLSRLHEDDKARAGKEIENHFKNDTPFDTEYRLRTKSG